MSTPANALMFRQATDLKKSYPAAQSHFRRGKLRWVGTIQPAEVADRYQVEITWDGYALRPTVRVLHPELQDLPDKKVPHVFPDMSLCLHMRDEWRPEMLISKSIIPWTSEWLLFYELWLVTGEWLGGGHEVGSEDAPYHSQLTAAGGKSEPASGERTGVAP